MKHYIFIALAILGASTICSISEAQSRQGAATSRQVMALKSALDSFATSVQAELTLLRNKLQDCGNVVHGTVDSNGSCPAGYTGQAARQCISGTWVPIFQELLSCDKTYTWVNLINRTETNDNACARIGMKSITEPGYATCASGENRFTEGNDHEAISYRYGAWGPTRPSIGPNISANREGHMCYHSTQHRDGDGSDIAVAALCEALDPGDPAPNPQPVDPYVPPAPPQNER